MRKAYLSLLAIAALTIVSCGGGEEKKEDKKDKKEKKEVKDTAKEEKVEYTHYVLDTATTLEWKGTHTGKDEFHTGTVKVTKGTLSISLAANKIESGMFVVDLNTIHNKDMEGTKGAENIEGHLKTPDFFNVEKFSTATLAVTGIENGAVQGKLSVAGTDINVSMPVQLSQNGEGQLKGKGTFTVDFSKANMPGTQPEEGKEEKGHVENKVTFTLNLVMNKK